MVNEKLKSIESCSQFIKANIQLDYQVVQMLVSVGGSGTETIQMHIYLRYKVVQDTLCTNFKVSS